MKHPLIYLSLSLLFLTHCSSDDDHQAAGNKPRLLSVVMSMQRSDGTLRPGYSRTFFYSSSGRLEREEYASYEIEEEKLYILWTDAFTYAGNKVTQVNRTRTDAGMMSTTNYTYDTKGRVSAIHLDDDIDTDVTITYEAGDTINAHYQNSNGRWFKYRMSMSGDNIVYGKTIDDSNRFANETYYEFDDNINPYSLLGFTDMFFENASKNNKLRQSSSYYTPSKPSSVPYSHEYTYLNGLPIKQTIRYKSTNTGEHTGVVQWEFEYEE